MSDSPPQRLSSFYLEDLVIIALGGLPAREAPPLHPVLGDEHRTRLRSRLKQLSRHDWPTSSREDPLLRRGYTLRQCLRLIASMMLIDAHLAPSEAIAFAKANELNLLRVMVPRLARPIDCLLEDGADDLLVVVPLGEIVSLVVPRAWRKAQPQRVRLLRRLDLTGLWSSDEQLHFPGQRLVVDIGTAAAAAWFWLTERKLMGDDARSALLTEIERERAKNGFAGASTPILQQR